MRGRCGKGVGMGTKLLPRDANGDNKNNAEREWGQSYYCGAGVETKMLPGRVTLYLQ